MSESEFRFTCGRASVSEMAATSPVRTTGSVRLPLLLALALLVAVAPIATDLYLPSFPAISADLDVSTSGVQLTLTAFLAGLAVGQLVMGPLSDRYGRRGPLIASAAVCVMASVGAAMAPTLFVLVAARLVQGISGAGGMVIGRAVVADLVTGREAARAFTLMMTVGGVAPVLAPLVGGLLFEPLGWRGLLWVVAGLCALMLVAVVLAVPETLPSSRRVTRRQQADGGVLRRLRVRSFWGYTGVFACAFGVMMAYISASPFIYQQVLGLSEVGYGVAFGVNACGLIGAGALVTRIARRVDPRRTIAVSLILQTAATASFLLLGLLGAPGWTYAVTIFFAVLSGGGIMGSATALAMSEVRSIAGVASAILGFSQFGLGAVVTPLVGLGGENSVIAPSIVMLCASLLAWSAFVLAVPHSGRRH